MITEQTVFVTARQAIRSGRWPMSESTFYELVKRGLIPKRTPHPKARPVYRVDDIDRVFNGEVEE